MLLWEQETPRIINGLEFSDLHMKCGVYLRD